MTQLGAIESYRLLDGQDIHAMQYRRAINVLKSFPKEITDPNEVKELYGIGPKMLAKIKEFLKNGSILEAIYGNDERMKCLELFQSIFNVGPKISKIWYETGCRDLEDVRKKITNLTYAQRIFLEHYDEVNKGEDINGIDEQEAEEIIKFLGDELKQIDVHATSEVVGGWRRGKRQMSGDIDFLISHPDDHRCPQLLAEYLEHLKKIGFLKYILTESPGVQDKESDHTVTAYTLCQGEKQKKKNCLRQIDFIMSNNSNYICTLIQWTGSKQFLRSLRKYCDKELNIHFANNKLIDERNSKEIIVKSEREFFEVLKLKYLEPEERNH